MSGPHVALTGLDGTNPLAFMAALGALRVAARRNVRLSWRNEGRWRPVLHGVAAVEDVIGLIVEDLSTWRDERVLGLAYRKDADSEEAGSRRRRARAEGGEIRDLKPPPQCYREFLGELATLAATGQRRSADYAACFASDVVQDLGGQTKPTALHFTAGQQQFLRMVRELVFGVTSGHLREALLGPWSGSSKLPSLSWDATVSRYYALRASDPSAEKRGSNPGVEWLAFRGLAFFVVAPLKNKLVTAACLDRCMRWPLWNCPASADSVRSLLTHPRLDELTASERRARGISVVLESAILRSDHGYGSFAPSRIQ